jgi:hypothetical protein
MDDASQKAAAETAAASEAVVETPAVEEAPVETPAEEAPVAPVEEASELTLDQIFAKPEDEVLTDAEIAFLVEHRSELSPSTEAHYVEIGVLDAQ